MNTEPRNDVRLGMRYGPDVWALKKGSLYSESTGRLIPATVKDAGITPLRPSLKAAVEGIQTCYGHGLVMGTDPEFFLTKNGLLVPAFDHLPDKHSSEDGLFWDGFQAETTVDVRGCNVPRCECKGSSFNCHVLLAQRIGQQLQKLVPRELGIAAQSVWRIPSQMLQLASSAQVSLGCEPSRNAYATHGRVVEEPRQLAYRFAGGHVHFTLSEAERRDRDGIRYLVKTLDALLGIPAVCLAQNYDHFIRRRYYGLAGEYRLPPHGLEYRTLSNFWLMHPQAFMLVFDLARHALHIGQARLRNVFAGSSQERSIQDCINFCDVRSAKDFMKLNKEFYSAWASATYGSDRAFWEAIWGGLDKVIPKWGQNVVASWNLPEWWAVPSWKDLK